MEVHNNDLVILLKELGLTTNGTGFVIHPEDKPVDPPKEKLPDKDIKK